jgi:hypothetical protein
MSNRIALVVGCGLLLAFVAQGVAFIEANSQTFDEAVHLAAGYSHITRGDFRLELENPPLAKMLWAVPVFLVHRPPFDPDPEWWNEADQYKWVIGRHFLYDGGIPADDLLRTGRRTNLVLGVLLVALVGWWAYRLWGANAGATAAGLAAFDPNLIAHSCLLTNDAANALFVVLFCYLLWEYAAAPSHRLLVGLGVTLGLALATKFTALGLMIVLGVLVVIRTASGGGFPLPGAVGPVLPTFGARLDQAFQPMMRIGFLAFAVLVTVYGGVGFGSWIKGLGSQLGRVAADQHFFFLGQCASRGWLAYFPVALGIKEPLATLVLAAVGLASCRLGRPLAGRDALFFLLPGGLYLAAMMVSGVDLGIRIVLPVLPFLFVLAGRTATLPHGLGPTLAVLGVALTAASSLSTAPRQLAYFNESVGGPRQGHRYLGDSNLDWGQDLKGLRDELATRGRPPIYLAYFGTAPPEAYGIRYRPLDPGARFWPAPALPPTEPPEYLAISMTALQGIYLDGDQDRYRWLETRTPVAVIGESIRLYDLRGDPEAQRRLAEMPK